MRGTVRELRHGLPQTAPTPQLFLVGISFHTFFPSCFTSTKPNSKVPIRLDAHAEITKPNHKTLLPHGEIGIAYTETNHHVMKTPEVEVWSLGFQPTIMGKDMCTIGKHQNGFGYAEKLCVQVFNIVFHNRVIPVLSFGNRVEILHMVESIV
jgi:hypothetical protein